MLVVERPTPRKMREAKISAMEMWIERYGDIPARLSATWGFDAQEGQHLGRVVCRSAFPDTMKWVGQ